MRLFITISLLVVTAAAFAAPFEFEPAIRDGGFQYFQAEDDDSETQSGYFTLAVIDGDVTVTLSDEPSAGALTHTFEAIGPRPSNGEWRRLYGPALLDVADDQASDQAVVLSNLRIEAGMIAVRDGWSITHGNLSVNDAIAAYSKWFNQAGATMTLDDSTAVANVRPYDVTGLSDDLRVVFHRVGAGVRVYIGKL